MARPQWKHVHLKSLQFPLQILQVLLRQSASSYLNMGAVALRISATTFKNNITKKLTNLIKYYKIMLFNIPITKKTIRRQPYSLQKIEA